MPQFVTNLLSLIGNYWPLLLALAAFTTALSQLCKAIAARFPRFTPVSNFVTHLAVDFVEALKVVGGLLAKRNDPKGPSGTGGAAVGLVVFGAIGAAIAPVLALCFIFAQPACSTLTAAGVPVLSQVDAVGRGLSQVLAWCEERGIDADTIAQAKQAVVDHDYGRAFELAQALVQKSRAAGDPIPEGTEVTLRLVEGALTAEVVQNFARKVSIESDAGAP